MPRRATSLSNIGDLAVSRLIDSKYDVVKAVAAKLTEIEQVAGVDVAGLVVALNEALDFTGITVVSGELADWNSGTKVLTVPTVKGDTGATGLQGIQGIKGDTGNTGNGIATIARTTGTGASGTTDTYTITYTDTTTDTFSVYNGADGVGPLASFVEIEFIGALGQTEFEFNYTDATTMDVIYNGAILSKSDWDASSGTLVTLTTPVSTAGDVIVIREWSIFSIVNAVTHAELNTHLGAYYDKTEVDTLLGALGTIAEFEQSI